MINWHQDGAGGWGLSIRPKVTIWTALDPTSVANGCLQIIPGSHKSLIPEQGDQLTPEERVIHAPDEKRIYLEMEMGEVVLLHNWTLHRSEVNTTNRPRRGFSVCYIDAATRQVSNRTRVSAGLPRVCAGRGTVKHVNLKSASRQGTTIVVLGPKERFIVTPEEFYHYDVNGYLLIEDAIATEYLAYLNERLEVWEEKALQDFHALPKSANPEVRYDDILNQEPSC